MTSEDIEGVVVINENGRFSIVSAAQTAKWENAPTFLHSGPLLLLDGVRQPLDSKTWYAEKRMAIEKNICIYIYATHQQIYRSIDIPTIV